MSYQSIWFSAILAGMHLLWHGYTGENMASPPMPCEMAVSSLIEAATMATLSGVIAAAVNAGFNVTIICWNETTWIAGWHYRWAGANWATCRHKYLFRKEYRVKLRLFIERSFNGANLPINAPINAFIFIAVIISLDAGDIKMAHLMAMLVAK